MSSPKTETIFLFGDQSGNILQSIKDASALSIHSNAIRTFFDNSMNRIHHLMTRTSPREHGLYLYKTSPLELALATKADYGGGSTAVTAALLCISQFAEVIAHLEANPRALEQSTSQQNVLVGTGVGLLTAAAVSCCTNLTEVLSLAHEVVELAFTLGFEAEKRSRYIEPLPPCSEHPYTWATQIVNQLDDLKFVNEVQRTIDDMAVPTHAKLYLSNVCCSSLTVTVSGPPLTMMKLLDQGGFQNSEKIHLPIRAAFHAEHLDPISWDDLVGDASQALLKRTVEHPIVGSSFRTSDFICGNTFADELAQVYDDILQFPVTMSAMIESLLTNYLQNYIGNTLNTVSLVMFGPESVDIPIKLALECWIEEAHGQKQPEDSHPSPPLGQVSQTTTPPASAAVDPRDIAIIGMGIRLPGSETLEEFWSILKEGRELHEQIPADRFDLSTHFDPSGIKPNMTSTPYGAFIKRPGYFDRHIFKMSPREARQTDPQQRLLLLATHEALEMAGYSPDLSTGAYPGRRVGSFIGQTSDDYREVNASQDIDSHFIPGGMRAFGPGRLHYHFGWEGPSYSIDTACSSSASAIQLAVSALLSKECDMAIGGGVNLLTSPDLFTGLCRGGFLSTTGGCKTFDDAADGYCRADAVGVVILKRLSDAIADRDVVHAVLRGAMTNHSAGAISITHPHAETQERLFTTLLTQLNLSPGDIDYVEMHGTGTQAGDATEMTSIVNALAKGNRTAANPLFVGSVKPNLGHGEGGSGVTSLIKAVMMLRENQIPPHIGIKSQLNRNLPPMTEYNTHLSMDITHFPRATAQHKPRRILINNFDAAGGNTSMIIQDPPPLPIITETIDPRPYHIITISGKTPTSAQNNTTRLRNYLNQHLEARLQDIAYTTTARRLHHHTYRQAYLVSSTQELSQNLTQTFLDNDPPASILHDTTTVPPFVIFVFTGQGCQYLSMAHTLYQTHPTFRDSLERMAKTSQSYGFTSFLPLITNPHLDATQICPVQTQTAITAIELALLNLWEEFGVKPDAIVGHSLGELAALCAAHVISVSTCLYLVGRRATLMAESCTAGTHAMLVVKESVDYVEKYLSTCEIACVNGPMSTVVSGPAQQIRDLQELFLQSGVGVKLLEVPFAFHSSQMDDILDDYEAEAEKVSFLSPRVPLASTVLGSLVTEHGVINAGYLRRQTRGRVRFSQAVDALRHNRLSKDRRRVWIEVGPHSACLNFIRSNLLHCTDTTDVLLSSMRKGEEDWKVLAGSMAAAYHAGVVIDWRAYHRPFEKSLRLLELPRYAFDLQNYWIQYEGDWAQRKGRCNHIFPNEKGHDTSSLYQIRSKQVNRKEVSITLAVEVSDPRLVEVLNGHKVNGNKLFSSSVYAEMALAAARYTQGLADPSSKTESRMDVRDVEVSEPLIIKGEDSTQLLLIAAHQTKGSDTVQVQFTSQANSQENETHHAKCQVVFGDRKTWQREWRQSARLVQARIEHLTGTSLQGPTHRILKPMAYKLFSSLVDYSPAYQGMQEVHLDSVAQEATAKVRFTASADEHFMYHPCWIDSLAHISGFVLNGSDTTPADTVYISHGWKSMRIAVTELSSAKTYQTYVHMQEDREAPGVMVGDVYVLQDGSVVAVIEEIKFRRIKRFQIEHFLPNRGEQSILARTRGRASKEVRLLWNEPGTAQEILNDNQTDIETQLSPTDLVLEIIAREVGIEATDLADHVLLADSGVDSLLALSIAARVKDALGWEIPSSLFFSSITVAELRENLAAYCRGSSHSTEDFSATPISTETTASDVDDDDTFCAVQSCALPLPCESDNSDKFNLEATLTLLYRLPPESNPFPITPEEQSILFLFPDGAGSASSYVQLSSSMMYENIGAIYGLNSPFIASPGSKNRTTTDSTTDPQIPLTEIVDAFIAAIRTIQPEGPYKLGGWSIGGVYAFEAMRRLQNGKATGRLFLIDPPCPKPLIDGQEYVFETAEGIIDTATLLRGNSADQAHFTGSMLRLARYHATPIHRPGLYCMLLWAQNGVLETIKPSAQLLFDSDDEDNAASDSVLYPRAYGPNGWDMLMPGTSIGCHGVNGDHFSIMRAPDVREVGMALRWAFQWI